MALDNEISISFTDDEVNQMNDALNKIESILEGKVLNLTAQQRQHYGKLGDGTENFVVKALTYSEQKPEIVPFYVDKEEMMKDVAARKVIDPCLNASALSPKNSKTPTR